MKLPNLVFGTANDDWNWPSREWGVAEDQFAVLFRERFRSHRMKPARAQNSGAPPRSCPASVIGPALVSVAARKTAYGRFENACG